MATRSFLSLYQDVSSLLAGCTIAGAAISIDTDKTAEAKTDVPPRIVFVPVSSVYGQPQAPGQSPSKEYPTTGIARPLLSKRLTIEAHCVGADQDACETMEAMVVTAVRQSARRNVVFTGADWRTPEWLTNGYLLTVRFDLITQVMEENLTAPVADATPATTTITNTGFDTSGASLTDGTLQAGEG